MAFVSWQTWTTGQVVTAADLNQDIRDNLNALFPDEETSDAATWSPTLEATTTNPTTSSAVGTTYRAGAAEFFWGRFVISTAGSGNYFVALPRASVNLTGSASTGSGSRVGGWHMRDDSTGNTAAGSIQIDGNDDMLFVIADLAAANDIVTDAVPWTMASGDVLTISGHYPIA